MRLRIQTKAPLPEVKAWYSPDANDPPGTIYELKQAICRQISPLKHSGVVAKQFTLLLDGFELLDESSLDVVRDGDLIWIQNTPGSSAADLAPHEDSQCGEKRKRQPSVSTSIVSLRQSSRLKPTQRGADESGSDSDSSDSSSSSGSPSTSSSSSSSDSSTSSSSSSHPPSSRQLPTSQKPKDTQRFFVPPGQGKLRTQQRNRRRRLKKKYDKDQNTQPISSPPKNISASNALPLGYGETHQATRGRTGASVANAAADTLFPNGQESSLPRRRTYTAATGEEDFVHCTTTANEPPEVMMASLKNKNKKKGYKQAMSAPLSAKIVFDDTGQAIKASAPPCPTFQATIEHRTAAVAPLIVGSASHGWFGTPSEKQDHGGLPPRMFVTSVDVESGLWDPRNGVKVDSHQGDQDEHAELDIHLDYGEADTAHRFVADSEDGHGVVDFDWGRAEENWDKFARVIQVEQLELGTLIGWKMLGLNPMTLSPEMLLSLAHVIRLPDPETQTQFMVQMVSRPGASEAFVSFGLLDTNTLSSQEQEYTWNDILELQWRIIAFN